jgi:hypothetical protein
MLAIAAPRARDQKPTVSIVPYAYGTDIRFLHHVPALRTGLLSLCPYGTPTRRHAGSAGNVESQPLATCNFDAMRPLSG